MTVSLRGSRASGDVLRGSSLSSLRGSGWCQLLGIAEGMPRCAGRGGACNVSGFGYGSARIGWQFLTVAAPLRQSTCMKGLGLSIFDRYLSATSLSRFSPQQILARRAFPRQNFASARVSLVALASAEPRL